MKQNDESVNQSEYNTHKAVNNNINNNNKSKGIRSKINKNNKDGNNNNTDRIRYHTNPRCNHSCDYSSQNNNKKRTTITTTTTTTTITYNY